jgi:DNA uptake protein ComE-like DNA-binding protein
VSRRPRRDEGIVLVIALVVLVMVVAIVLELARESRIEVNVAARELDEVKVRAIAESGVERALSANAQDTTKHDTLLDEWRNDENAFKAFQVGEGKCWLTFGEPDPGDGHEQRYGIQDEASKLNVNTATRDQLLKIPGIDEPIADAIMDWRDADEDESDQGAESVYYNTLDPPYSAKNGPIESIDELLRIKGIDESVLYGEDRNLNGILDPGEDDGDKSFPPDDADGVLRHGIAAYLTVYSMDKNDTKDGKARLNAGSADDVTLGTRLVDGGIPQGQVQQIMLWKRRRGQLQSIGDFLETPLVDDAAFAVIADELTTIDAPTIPGRINVNTASKAVLSGLPGLTDEDVAAIVSRRLGADEDLSTPAWLLKVLPRPKVRAIIDLVTTRSCQFTVQVAACLDQRPSVTRRISVLVDRNYAPPRLLIRRDLTPLGFPIPGERGESVP